MPAGLSLSLSRPGRKGRAVQKEKEMNRREFIKKAAVFSLLIFSGARLAFKAAAKHIIRPPGSLTEDDFNYKCVRCGKCILACPAKCLKPVPFKTGLAEWAVRI